MKVCIKECGDFIFADKTGVINSELDLDCIQPKWYGLVRVFRYKVTHAFKNRIHSIFLRGSVASGSAASNVADIDFVVITKDPLNKKDKLDIQSIGDSLLKKYKFVTKFDIKFYTENQILRSKEKIYVKIGSICVFGKDIRKRMKELKVGRDIAITLSQLRANLRKYTEGISTGSLKGKDKLNINKMMMKRMLRSGLELVSTRAWCYTRDIYQCWVIFSRFYPEYSKLMHKALGYAINTPNDPKKIKKLFPMGRFMLREAKKYKIV